jgi:formate-dependent phosphoribosylglycinamide formyltransferase (GAR transformylase)
MRIAVRGVNSEGFMTTVFPVASCEGKGQSLCDENNDKMYPYCRSDLPDEQED